LNKLSSKNNKREIILRSLNDIARDLDLFDKVEKYDVTQISLLRDKTVSMVKGQYHRMAGGGARLTEYEFSYFPVGYSDDEEQEKVELKFDVVPEEMPPTNIHVLIGKNGVGKTTLLKNMLCSLEFDEDIKDYGAVDMGWTNHSCANIVFVSFSAFDEYLQIEEPIIPYLHIGLSKEEGMKDYDELSKEFAQSLYKITKAIKKKVWTDTISILESDNTFTELNVKSWSIEKCINTSIIKSKNRKRQGEESKEYRERIEKIETEIFTDKIAPKFKKLSSGHKVILLTVAKLVETVEEKTLVLLDEPEEHLHPPLVSAFIRALSNLLIYRNGVGIIATHSPVIVQEVPKKCVWILRREGNELVADRPQIETFGENLGILTSEIFGFEVTNSGFHKMLNDIVAKKSSYRSALRLFHGELGEEGKSMLRSLMYEKEQLEGKEHD
jgi:ABC-type cobalamin/Fe3+-siderophores transport system ATPase subunit